MKMIHIKTKQYNIGYIAKEKGQTQMITKRTANTVIMIELLEKMY